MKRREALKSLLLLPAVAGAISRVEPVAVSALENPSLPITPLYLGNPRVAVIMETVENGHDYWEQHNKRALNRFKSQLANEYKA